MRILRIGGYYHNDRPDGLGLLLTADGDGDLNDVAEVIKGASLNGPEPGETIDQMAAELQRQIEQVRVASKNRRLSEDEVILAMINIQWLQSSGYLPGDEFNGMQFIGDDGRHSVVSGNGAAGRHQPIEKPLALIDQFRKQEIRMQQIMPGPNILLNGQNLTEAVPYVFPDDPNLPPIQPNAEFAPERLPDAMLLLARNVIVVVEKVVPSLLSVIVFGLVGGSSLPFMPVHAAVVEFAGEKRTVDHRPPADRPNDGQASEELIGMVFGMLAYIQQPNIYADLIDPPAAVQKSRAKHGKRPLPAYRVIRPGQVILRNRNTSAGTNADQTSGTPKCPHWRQGAYVPEHTFVRKRDGRVIHRRGFFRKGGPVKGGQPDNRPVVVLPAHEPEWK